MTDDPARESERPRDQLREEAATWFARMRGEDADQHRAAFESWLARGAVHRAAYNRIGEVFAAGKELKGYPDGKSGMPRVRETRASAMVIAAVTACAVFASIILVRGDWRTTARSSEAFVASSSRDRMTTDRVRRFPLATGAEVTLDTDSLLATRVGDFPSVDRLVRGRARFSVPHAQGVRHVILAGPATVVSHGGVFDLWLRSDGSLDAQALTGEMALSPTANGFGRSPEATVAVLPGRHYRMTNVGRLSILSQALGRDWPRGILEFRGTPLADVVEEANRYGAVKIVLGDDALGTVRMSGRFRIDDPPHLAERLAAVLALRVDRSSPGVIILRRQQKVWLSP